MSPQHKQTNKHHTCTSCDYTANSAVSVRKHSAIHTEGRPGKADTMETEHTEEKKLVCPTCGKNLASKASLIGHIRVRHMAAVKRKRSEPADMGTGDQGLATEGSQEFSSEDIAAALQAWRHKLSEEKELFLSDLPIMNAFLDENYFSDDDMRMKVATKVKAGLEASRDDSDMDGSCYLYTLHDPSISRVPFHQLMSHVDRHTKFKIFLSSLFYIGCGRDAR